MNEREFDIVLWGATGFTGQLVAETLLARHGAASGPRWALGGRNEARLRALRDRLGAGSLPIVLGDGNDPGSMAAVAARTRVVCTTAGPYARIGSALIGACAKGGTHYCDLTGELPWIHRMIAAHQEDAAQSGARIVPSCGFDSIPSDLGVWFMQREMRARRGGPGPRVKCGVAGFSGGASGGTIASMIAMLDEASRDASIRRVLADPDALTPPGAPRNGARDALGAAFDDDFGQWTAPFVMAALDTRVVRRSAGLLPSHYGADFRYEESMLVGDGPAAAWKAHGLALGTGLAMGAMTLGPLRRFVEGRLPAPGEGPSEEARENGYWDLRFWAEAPAGAGGPLRGRVQGDRDPGYGSTSKMLVESAVCLAGDDLDSAPGFLTPAAAMGDALLERLQKHAGVSFEIVD